MGRTGVIGSFQACTLFGKPLGDAERAVQMSANDHDARGRLRKLVELLLAGTVSVAHFCEAFERIYNLELDRSTLTAAEAPAFAAIFDRVVWYSPFPEERARIPNYLGEDQIIATVSLQARALGIIAACNAPAIHHAATAPANKRFSASIAVSKAHASRPAPFHAATSRRSRCQRSTLRTNILSGAGPVTPLGQAATISDGRRSTPRARTGAAA
jgi:hypothetical protein